MVLALKSLQARKGQGYVDSYHHTGTKNPLRYTGRTVKSKAGSDSFFLRAGIEGLRLCGRLLAKRGTGSGEGHFWKKVEHIQEGMKIRKG
jgi:hypothetical protein